MMLEPLRITVLICTHNRVELLTRVIESLNAARRPTDCEIRLFVVANACADGTHDFLAAYGKTAGGLPLEWIAEPTPGKSHALNCALPMITDPVVAFVDDDHRVDTEYLAGVAHAASTWPEAGLICGRILPDWDGTEPEWVHNDGPYHIYPLPVPRYDQGPTPTWVNLDGSIPGGGNLVGRLEVIRSTGPFLTELGPTGHDLGGAEDLEWVRRAMRHGAKLHYAPEIVQYHYVDCERLTLSYLMRKGFQRSKSVMRFHRAESGVPLYMWRKIGGYVSNVVFSMRAQARRFYLVRLASSLGEVSGIREQTRRHRKRAKLPILPEDIASYVLIAFGFAALVLAGLVGRNWLGEALLAASIVGAGLSVALVAKSLRDFSRTGPTLRDEIMHRYRGYVIYALGRLALLTFAVAAYWAFPGGVLWIAAIETLNLNLPDWTAIIGASLTLIAATVYAGSRALLLNPGLIIASWQYRTAVVHRLWTTLSPHGLEHVARALAILGMVLVGALALLRVSQGAVADAAALVLTALGYASLQAFTLWEPKGRSRPAKEHQDHPNLLMIGSDTLRADRIGLAREGKSITPNIDKLAARGSLFSSCYVPCARTAPSLITLLTGTWPHTHGVRDNFVADEDAQLEGSTLPNMLRQFGYRTAAVSDWCGADLGKFNFGFDVLELPEDQWNLKYLIRQGPKDIRLFLSLFLHNRIGRMLLPEVYYLGGVPQTTQLGKRGRQMISRLGATNEPFFLNLFYSTTHPPFASEYPYYIRFSDPDYKGESKFAMARLTEPFEIIRRQGEPREEFDLDQILDLYDGCVAQFDDEVGKTLKHLEDTGLLQNTLVVVYSDHGMEFFEHGTWGQGNSALGDFSARVPLIIAGPGSDKGQRIDQVVRTVDIMPTLLELLQAPPVKSDGISLVPAIVNPMENLSLSAYNETGIWITPMPGLPVGHLSYPNLLHLLDVPDDSTGTLSIKDEFLLSTLVAKDRMIRRGQWKLVYQPLEEGSLQRLFNLETDPECQVDVYAQHPEIAQALRLALSDWMASGPN